MSIGTRIAALTIAVSSMGMYATSAVQRAQTAPPAVPDAPVAEEPLIDGMVPVEDLYGNEVPPAIANYKIDPFGILYEEHSPDTELPRLGIPRS